MKNKTQVVLSATKAGARTVAHAFEPVSHGMTFLLFTFVFVALAYLSPATPVVEYKPAQPGVGVCQPNALNNWCAPVNDPQVAKAVKALEAKGFDCSDNSTITDTIIFQHKADKRVEVVDFDTAFVYGKKGLGWNQKFCK
ncbi:hypothetical protein [Aeromicrobium sp. 179-A 4D2 NHS]|uniref:hypothetical protein n=1 Tax=Aeromicrobium sp. 179-A 4D2 NHS TaxID=3142375 RepID=UPI0039A39C6F